MPGFAPSDVLTATNYIERLAQEIVEMYSFIEAELLGQVAARLARDLTVHDNVLAQLAVVRDLQDTARRLLSQIPPDIAAQIVQRAITEGTAATLADLGLTDSMSRISTISPMAANTLALIAQDIGNAFDQVALRILRYPIDAVGNFIGSDAFQATVARHLGQITVGGMTTNEARKRVIGDFLEQGITGFTDRAGRRWKIGTYTEMAVRTGSARAYTETSLHLQRSIGGRFVTILGNNDACRLCAPWFGKILSIDGTPAGIVQAEHATRDFEYVDVEVAGTLDDARQQGLMHPNCGCKAVQYLPGLRAKRVASEYNAEAEAGRVEQRALEVKLRDLKQKLRIAEGLDEADRVAALKRKIREKQAEIRALIAETGQPRMPEREQPQFSYGSGRYKPQRPPVPVVAPAPPDVAPESPVRVGIGDLPSSKGS